MENTIVKSNSVLTATFQMNLGQPLSSIFFLHLLQKRTFGRVATNLENLVYSGISLNMENACNSQGILCNLGEKL